MSKEQDAAGGRRRQGGRTSKASSEALGKHLISCSLAWAAALEEGPGCSSGSSGSAVMAAAPSSSWAKRASTSTAASSLSSQASSTPCTSVALMAGNCCFSSSSFSSGVRSHRGPRALPGRPADSSSPLLLLPESQAQEASSGASAACSPATSAATHLASLHRSHTTQACPVSARLGPTTRARD